MDKNIEAGIKLRAAGKLTEANQLLLKIYATDSENPFLNYQLAWSFDVLGQEAEAVPFYEKALALGLEQEYLAEAYLGLGSTYRTLGKYPQAKTLFAKAIKQFPEHNALKVFFAMSLFNLNEHQQGMEILLKLLATTSNDPTIQKFNQAILFYADKLNQTW